MSQNKKKQVSDSEVTVKTSRLKKRMPKNISLRSVIIVGLVVIFGLLTWQYLEAKSELKKYNDPAKAIQQESEDTVSEVGKIMVLPTGEQPVPAKIQDITKFKDNPAFANAQNGDVVLIYREQSRLIIYRPSTKQIVWTALYDASSADAPTEQ